MSSTGTAQRQRPTIAPDGSSNFNDRNTGYGERYVIDIANSLHDQADEGSVYMVGNPTIDTAVGMGVLAAYSATIGPMLFIANTDTKRSIRLIALKMFRFTVAPASGTSTMFAVDVDTSLRLSTAPTGGVNRTSGVVNVNPAYPNDFNGVVYAATGGSMLTLVAAAAGRTVTRGMLSNSIPVALDQQLLVFGQGNPGATALAAGVGMRVAGAGPVVIPPGCSGMIEIYYPSNAITGASFEYELLMSQR